MNMTLASGPESRRSPLLVCLLLIRSVLSALLLPPECSSRDLPPGGGGPERGWGTSSRNFNLD